MASPAKLNATGSSTPLPLDRGTRTGRALLEGRAIRIPDVLADPEYRATRYQELAGYRSTLSVPLLRDGTTIGVFGLGRREPNPFTDKQAELVTTFADQAVIAIENVRLFDEVQARTREVQESLEYQTAISDVLNVISRSPNKLQPVLDMLVQTAARLCEADFSVFFRLHEGKCYIGASNAEDDFIKFARENPFVPTLSSCSGRALLERRTVHVVDASTDPEYAMPGYQLVANNRTMLGVPLLREGVAIGAITLWKTRVEPFTEKQIDLVTTFADQALIAIENTRLFEAEQQRTRELTESLEQQTATSEVLQVISSSPGELEPVFSTILGNATRICGAKFGTLYLREADGFRTVAMHNAPPAFVEVRQRNPVVRPKPGTVLASVITTRRAVQIADVQTEADVSETSGTATTGAQLARLAGARTVVAVPMVKEDQLIGAILIFRQEVQPFSDNQIELLTNFAAQAVIAIENARLLNELRQRTSDLTERTADLTEALEQQTATAEVLQVISSSPGDLEPVFATMLEKAVSICDAKYGNIYRWDGGFAPPCRTRHATGSRRISPTFSASPSLIRRMVETKTAIHVIDVAADPEYLERRTPSTVAAVELGGVRSFLSVPMLKENELIGSFSLYR